KLKQVFGSVKLEGTALTQRARTASIALWRSGPLRAFRLLINSASSQPDPMTSTDKQKQAAAGNPQRMQFHEFNVMASRMSVGCGGNVLRIPMTGPGIVRLSAFA